MATLPRYVAVLLMLSLSMFAIKHGKRHTVDLNWIASVTPNVTYNVYRKPSGSTYALEASAVVGTSWTDHAVQSGQVYSYVLTSYDGLNESIYSNEFQAVIPFP